MNKMNKMKLCIGSLLFTFLISCGNSGLTSFPESLKNQELIDERKCNFGHKNTIEVYDDNSFKLTIEYGGEYFVFDGKIGEIIKSENTSKYGNDITKVKFNVNYNKKNSYQSSSMYKPERLEPYWTLERWTNDVDDKPFYSFYIYVFDTRKLPGTPPKKISFKTKSWCD